MQCGELTREAPIHKVTWPVNHLTNVRLRDKLKKTYLRQIIWPFDKLEPYLHSTYPLPTKFNRVLTNHGRLSFIKPQDFWSHEYERSRGKLITLLIILNSIVSLFMTIDKYYVGAVNLLQGKRYDIHKKWISFFIWFT